MPIDCVQLQRTVSDVSSLTYQWLQLRPRQSRSKAAATAHFHLGQASGRCVGGPSPSPHHHLDASRHVSLEFVRDWYTTKELIFSMRAKDGTCAVWNRTGAKNERCNLCAGQGSMHVIDCPKTMVKDEWHHIAVRTGLARP